MSTLIKCLSAAITLLSAPLALAADASNADDIIRQARDRHDGKSFISEVTLALHDKNGNTRQREFTYLQKDYPDADKFTIFFRSPQDVRNVAFHIENPREDLGKEDAQWMYLPVSRQTRRISTTDKRGAFMGSNYSYADLDKIRANDYKQTLRGEEDILARPCHVVEREPVSPAILVKTGYNKVVTWIDKQNHLVMRQDFYDVKGVLIKQMLTKEVKTVDGIDSITHSETTHFVNGTRSEMRFSTLKYNVELDDRLFSEQAIRRGLQPGERLISAANQ